MIGLPVASRAAAHELMKIRLLLRVPEAPEGTLTY